MSSIKMLILLIGLLALPIENQSMAQDFRAIENKAFKVGEKLIFNINYGFITAGIAEWAIPEMKKISGRDTYHITFKVSSVSSFDLLYKVRDRYESYLDSEGLFPWRFEQHIREGGYTKDFSAFFDQRKGKAKTSEGSYDIPKYVNDIVSAFFLTRTFDFSKMKPGEKYHLENFYKDKVYPLDVVYRGKERITVEAGTFDCIIIEPLVKEGGLFKHDGDIIIWLTDDALKLPVKVKTKIIIGSIDAELKSYEGLAGKLTAKR